MQDKKEQAKVEVATLVEKFHSERRRNQSEADVRAGYIDQLFFALGWNIHNDPGQQTNYWREGYIRGAGFVDVGMEISGQPVLFLEAKRFGVIPETARRTGDRSHEEKQAFRYTRGRKIQYAILTNFERLQLFNADHERLIGAFDAPEEYLEKFEELWRLTPEEVSGGSLGWWERDLEKKDVDLEFLKWLRAWRLTLANTIFEHNAGNPEIQRNGAFDFDKLMEAVQRILDRLILIRYGDDKEVLLAHDLLENTLDEYRKRGAYAGKAYLMRAFVDLSHMMDEHHNTTLFAPDHLCEKVVIPNEVLASVLDELSRISFRKFTSDILGNTYESYLGTKLKLVNGQIEDEERTDLRKGQGIYYTPSWVVEYIVDNTLGERLREMEQEHRLHAIEKVRGLSVVDPACGSGSFLIKAYNIFADFYQRMNQGIIQEQTKLAEAFASADMFERLERLSHLPQQVLDYPQVILKEHLYGVDLDPEAAELATVNLTMQAFADSRQKKLPQILNENIKVGNSLISGTEEELKPYFGEAWAEKRPFNWAEEFPAVMERGGFDVVIGNPPYGALMKEADARYYQTVYPCFASARDVYVSFIEKGLELAKNNGFLSLVVPSAWLGGPAYRRLRELLLSKQLHFVISLPFDVFPAAYVDTAIFVVSNNLPKIDQTISTYVFPKRTELAVAQIRTEMYKAIAQSTWETADDKKFILEPEAADVIGSLRKRCQRTLKDVILMRRGVLFDRKLLIDSSISEQSYPYFEGDIYRYQIYSRGNKWIEFGPNIKERPKETKWFQEPRILLRRLVNRRQRIMAAPSSDKFITNKNLYSLLVAENIYPLPLMLGVINSKLISYIYVKQVSQATKDDFPQITIKDFLALPFPNSALIDKHGPAFTVLVERMLAVQARLKPVRATGLTEEHDLLQEVERVDSDIDKLVYDLYGLTEAERQLVAGG